MKDKIAPFFSLKTFIIAVFFVFFYTNYLKQYSFQRMTNYQNNYFIYLFAAMAIVFIFYFYKNLIKTKISVLFVSFLLFCFLITIINGNFSLINTIFVFIYVFILFFIPYILQSKKYVFFICAPFVLLNLPLAIIGIYTFLTGNVVYSGVTIYNPQRLLAHGHPNASAICFIMCIIFLILMLCYSKSKYLKPVIVLLIPVFAIAASLTKSRTMNISFSFCLGFVVAYFLHKKVKVKKINKMVVFAILFIIIMGLMFVVLTTTAAVFDDFTNTLTPAAVEELDSEPIKPKATSTIGGRTLSDIISFNGRTDIWLDALSCLTPQILLKGYSTDIDAVSEYIGHDEGPHSLYVTFLLCLGLPGLVFLIAFIFNIIMRIVYKLLCGANFSFLLISTVFVFITISETMENMVYSLGYITMFYMLSAGFIYYKTSDFSAKKLIQALKNI